MDFIFDEKQDTPLCEIMGRYGSDKGDVNINLSWHNYTTFYYHIFNERRTEPLRVFELGLGTNNIYVPSNMGPDGKPGASLYGWAEFFSNPDTKIFGADIDKDILFNTDKIKTFYCDQTNPDAIKNMWSEPVLEENFDIIVEDGLHELHANKCFFENSFHKLKPNGYFIIEDIVNKDIAALKEIVAGWEATYTDCKFKVLEIPSLKNTCDNILLVIRKNDIPK